MKPPARPLFGLLCLLWALGIAGSAAAAPPGASQQEVEADYSRSPSPALLERLGQLAQQQGAQLPAADLYRRYLDAASPPSHPAAYDALLAQVEPLAAEVAIDGEEGALLRVDGRLVGRLPLGLPLLLGAGPHKLLLTGQAAATADTIQVTAGEPLRIVFPRSGSGLVEHLSPTLVLAQVGGRPLLDGPAASGPLAPTVLRLLRRIGQLHVLPAQRVQTERRQLPAPCRSDAPPATPAAAERCALLLGRRLGARYIIDVAPAAGPGSPLAIAVTDVAVGQLSGRRQLPCGDCTTGAAAEQLGQGLEIELERATSRQHGELQLDSQPAGAAILLDEAELGLVTPQRLVLFTGSYALTLRRPDFLPLRRPLVVAAGSRDALSLPLAPNLAAVRRRRLLLGKWALLGGSGAALVAGGVLLGVNGTTRDDPTAPKLQSWPGGLAALGGGLLGIAATIVLWRLERVAAQAAAAADR